MSGGVDSSFTASYLTQQGFNCCGVTMMFMNLAKVESNVNLAKQTTSMCCMNHVTLNYVEEFRKIVIEPFVKFYENGLTPNPCVWCNQFFKFGKLLTYALNNGFDYLATGHYARVCYSNRKQCYVLKKAVDLSKDQTYFLYFLNQEQLAHVLFPLGDFSKKHVKKQAKMMNFASAYCAESQDICFVNGVRYSSFISNFTKKKYCSGNFVDENGKVLGKHRGIIHYTVGQRKGLNLALHAPVYVKKINVLSNEIVLATRQNLFVEKILLNNVNLISISEFKGKLPVMVKLRYTMVEFQAFLSLEGKGYAVVQLQSPQIMPAKGQVVVFYDDDVVIGGGVVA